MGLGICVIFTHSLFDDVYALKLIRTLDVMQEPGSTIRIQPVILTNSRISEDLVAQYATELGMQVILRRYILMTRAYVLTSEIRDYFRSSDIPEGFQPVGKPQRVEGSVYGVLCLPTALMKTQGVTIGKWYIV